MAEGREIGHRARNSFPGGILVDEFCLDAAAAKTLELMAYPNVPAISEATRLVDQFVANADILVRQPCGWSSRRPRAGLPGRSTLRRKYKQRPFSSSGIFRKVFAHEQDGVNRRGDDATEEPSRVSA